jgi:pimeloyl-ACP methyl ester carboxylesterase
MSDGTVKVGGDTFHYLSEGDANAPLALCLHGFPDHPHSFRPMMRRLADAGYRAVAPWMRGYSPSVLSGPYHADQLAADANSIGDALSPDAPYALIGHDWGAVTLYQAIAAQPDRFRCAVAMAVPHPLAFFDGFRRDRGQLLRSWYMLFFQLPFLPELVVPRDDFAFVDRLWRAWSPGYALDPDARAELHRCLGASMPAPIEYYRAIAQPPREAYARFKKGTERGATTVPTMMLHGANDGCISVELSRGQERYYEGPFEFGVIEGAGHFFPLEAPDATADRVLAWLGQHA